MKTSWKLSETTFCSSWELEGSVNITRMPMKHPPMPMAIHGEDCCFGPSPPITRTILFFLLIHSALAVHLGKTDQWIMKHLMPLEMASTPAELFRSIQLHMSGSGPLESVLGSVLSWDPLSTMSKATSTGGNPVTYPAVKRNGEVGPPPETRVVFL